MNHQPKALPILCGKRSIENKQQVNKIRITNCTSTDGITSKPLPAYRTAISKSQKPEGWENGGNILGDKTLNENMLPLKLVSGK
ncbi:hypothetical protein [uncultured Mucilaginibacter sp.]|uniref:hypothetical protein n=1 Tax=uncultured Mucilaginibacter sp. TaxID=797541 RepID=UPI002636A73A|nr:hypothetical protein [uncultured Mucilaginibacter sp.]